QPIHPQPPSQSTALSSTLSAPSVATSVSSVASSVAIAAQSVEYKASDPITSAPTVAATAVVSSPKLQRPPPQQPTTATVTDHSTTPALADVKVSTFAAAAVGSMKSWSESDLLGLLPVWKTGDERAKILSLNTLLSV